MANMRYFMVFALVNIFFVYSLPLEAGLVNSGLIPNSGLILGTIPSHSVVPSSSDLRSLDYFNVDFD